MSIWRSHSILTLYVTHRFTSAPARWLNTNSDGFPNLDCQNLWFYTANSSHCHTICHQPDVLTLLKPSQPSFPAGLPTWWHHSLDREGAAWWAWMSPWWGERVLPDHRSNWWGDRDSLVPTLNSTELIAGGSEGQWFHIHQHTLCGTRQGCSTWPLCCLPMSTWKLPEYSETAMLTCHGINISVTAWC